MPEYVNEYVEKLRKLADLDDPEVIHGAADDLLCDLLKKLGYDEVVKCFDELPRWYG